ncbi:MAG TPA: FAD:protein FMN transferase [Patescibacteria group bacterium]|nr:FAD:protein FMN transferase [Patescibacteria group bacterium]
MKQTKLIMGMPITVEIVDAEFPKDAFKKVYEYFTYIDNKFSTYKKNSEISQINERRIKKSEYSPDMRNIFALSQKTKEETDGYFDILHNGKYDPSGLVKGWAIWNAAALLKKMRINNFYIDAGGDIQVAGKNKENKLWKVGIRNPFNRFENVKIVYLDNLGIATSGTAVRGNHIYNPKKEECHPRHDRGSFRKDSRFRGNDREGGNDNAIVSLTVIGLNVYEADRFATAAFAMGQTGIKFIEKLEGFEGYLIDKNGIATYTSGFEQFTHNNGHVI